MQIRSAEFKALATEKLADPNLFRALSNLRGLMVSGRAKVILELDNFEETREAARQVRDSALEHLDFLLEEFERNATARGAKVHWAEDSQQMNQLVLDIARRANVRKVIKSKSMLGKNPGSTTFWSRAASRCARPTWANTSSRNRAIRRPTSSARPSTRPGKRFPTCSRSGTSCRARPTSAR